MFIQAGAGLRTNFNIFIQKMYQDKKKLFSTWTHRVYARLIVLTCTCTYFTV